MPELPEVETICNGLRNGNEKHLSVLDKQIKQVIVNWDKSIAAPSVEIFRSSIVGQKIVSINRRGKFILIQLTSDVLVIHLRMSGDLYPRSMLEEPNLHDRLILFLDETDQLVFNDPRKFGRVWLVNSVQEVIGNLGPEPFDPNLTPQIFHRMLVDRKKKIKPLLLDQSFIAGLGNIYTDEALFSSRILPLRSAQNIPFDQAENLLFEIRRVLQAGILHHGASIDWVYKGGDFQNHFSVYRRTCQPCYICRQPIQRIILGQRSTHFCPKCQT